MSEAIKIPWYRLHLKVTPDGDRRTYHLEDEQGHVLDPAYFNTIFYEDGCRVDLSKYEPGTPVYTTTAPPEPCREHTRSSNQRLRPAEEMEMTTQDPSGGIPPDARAIVLAVSSRARALEAINSLSFARVVGDKVSVSAGITLDIHVLVQGGGTIICAIGNPTPAILGEFRALALFHDPSANELGLQIVSQLLEKVKQTGGGNVWYVS